MENQSDQTLGKFFCISSRLMCDIEQRGTAALSVRDVGASSPAQLLLSSIETYFSPPRSPVLGEEMVADG